MDENDPSGRTVALNAPAIAQALRRIRNPGPRYRDCLCGRCPAGGDASYSEIALDASLIGAMDMVYAIESNWFQIDPASRLALHSLHGLITNARLLLCMQRHEFRAEVVSRGMAVDHRMP